MTGLKRVTELAFDSHKDKDKQISNEVFKGSMQPRVGKLLFSVEMTITNW